MKQTIRIVGTLTVEIKDAPLGVTLDLVEQAIKTGVGRQLQSIKADKATIHFNAHFRGIDKAEPEFKEHHFPVLTPAEAALSIERARQKESEK